MNIGKIDSAPSIASAATPEGEDATQDTPEGFREKFMKSFLMNTIIFPREGTPLAEAAEQRDEDM